MDTLPPWPAYPLQDKKALEKAVHTKVNSWSYGGLAGLGARGL